MCLYLEKCGFWAGKLNNTLKKTPCIITHCIVQSGGMMLIFLHNSYVKLQGAYFASSTNTLVMSPNMMKSTGIDTPWTIAPNVPKRRYSLSFAFEYLYCKIKYCYQNNHNYRAILQQCLQMKFILSFEKKYISLLFLFLLFQTFRTVSKFLCFIMYQHWQTTATIWILIRLQNIIICVLRCVTFVKIP